MKKLIATICVLLVLSVLILAREIRSTDPQAASKQWEVTEVTGVSRANLETTLNLRPSQCNVFTILPADQGYLVVAKCR